LAMIEKKRKKSHRAHGELINVSRSVIFGGELKKARPNKALMVKPSCRYVPTFKKKITERC